MSHQVTKRYARALYELSNESKQVQSVRKDLAEIRDLIDASQELADFLHNPVIPRADQDKIIARIFGKRFTDLTYQFLFFLNAKNRLSCLRSVCLVFEQMFLENAGVLPITIASSVELNAEQTRDIAEHMKAKLGKEIDARTSVDPGLIGGIRISQGNTVFDYSFNAQLERFRKNILKA